MKVIDLIKRGLLKEGQVLVWPRKKSGQVHEATVLSTGKIRTLDGIEHNTPSGAAKHLNSSRPIDGWNAWKLKGTKTALSEIRAKASQVI